MGEIKEEKIINRLEQHLRMTSRQLIKIGTEEEAIHYLIDSFKSELYCDFVGVILAETGEFVPKAWGGNANEFGNVFPMEIDKCSPVILEQSLHSKETNKREDCILMTKLKETGVKTWFTVPLTDDVHRYGFCIIGFFTYVPLLEMDEIFDEFGKDVAIAISLARRKDQQLRKIEGIEWINRNLSINQSLKENISEFTTRAGLGTNAQSACIYLFNEKENCFDLQVPIYGVKDFNEKVIVGHKNTFKEYFSFIEKSGGHQITIPIVVDLKTIGVLQVGNKNGNLLFSEDDVNTLKLLSDHIAILLENALLYNLEKDHRERLQILLDYQQALVKETVVNDDFHGVTQMLAELYCGSVILLDRFYHPLSYKIEESELGDIGKLREVLENERIRTGTFKVLEPGGPPFLISPINGVNALLGYLAICINNGDLDEFDQLTVELSRNICSIQFIKQKLVLDADKQAKDTLMGKLLVKNIEDEQSILQYANLFQWDIFKPHRVANLSIELAESEVAGLNLFEQTAKKSIVWDYINEIITLKSQKILMATFSEHYLFIVPVEDEKNRKQFWADFYKRVRKAVSKSLIKCEVHLGIGSKVENMNEYSSSYEQSLQVLNVVKSRFKSKGYSLFEEIGSYTILHDLNFSVVTTFIHSQLGVLLDFTDKKNIDLFQTLSVYLRNNGNAKGTSEELFIHRSSLLYRLEKIESVLEIDLNDSETRFNLMMAMKLYDLNRQAFY
ncbi:PucR family transcriptional regulator [Lysinibacillus contaminans]|uniref:PucR family transcriptional regulator n=1 Tax=Lysinibacillus contaminans TaxID=1293441 RepID=A0ABR5K1M5_9BACI|nr:helix-turn-helix domain-containing protein [Lysinibacillus contaminans]KOS68825.1 PucR family transcriptional regulator [Lysinibacillus contaminans]